MYEGIPSLFDFVINLLKSRPQRDSFGIVTYHLLGDVKNASRHALYHYFTLTLEERFLQRSHIGTPYQKWAKFTNEDFQELDVCMKRLIIMARSLSGNLQSEAERNDHIKDACGWFYKLQSDYVSCLVNPDEPTLAISGFNVYDFFDHQSGLFCDELPHTILDIMSPSFIVKKSVVSIADRSVLNELQNEGIARLEQMSASLEEISKWLQANYTIQDITAPHDGILPILYEVRI